MLTRIYGTSFPNKEALEEELNRIEEAKKRDHRKLGKELGIFTLMEEGPGFPFFLPKGMILKNLLLDYWRHIHTRDGYVEISTPIMLDRELWETSGHWDHYRENMYTTVIDDEDFAIKPMNCPGGMLVYKMEPHSYRDLPIRMGEIGLVHRHEKSGQLHGLMRVRCFNQDDAHIYMTPEQIPYEIKVRYDVNERVSIENIENMLIPNGYGQNIHVRDIATVRESSIPPTIERKDRQRIVTVDAVLASGEALSKGVELGYQICDSLDLPSGVTYQVAGSYEDQQDSDKDLGTLGILIIILVFIVMAAQFESLTYPFIIILSIVFAFSGIIFSLMLTGTTLNIMSTLGGIMLIGIVVKNGIVLIDYTQLLRERKFGLIRSAVVAARSRLRPILMTTLTTILGMVPMAVSQGVGAEMWRPLGISVIGGLTVSTILTLIYVPTMFCIFGGVGITRKRKAMKESMELDAYWKENKEKELKFIEDEEA